MTTQPTDTQFAPAERADEESVRRHARRFADSNLPQLFDAVNEVVVILNRQRQIVFANRALAEMLGVAAPQDLHGLRPGEAIGCQHACQRAGGCGTTEFCSACGAVSAILGSQAGRQEVRECHILAGPRGEAMDLLVRATPLRFGREDFTLFAVTDISHEKRRRTLERVFFHDLLNTATAVQVLCGALRRSSGKDAPPVLGDLARGVDRMIDEIASQRDLMSAESGDLPVRPVEVEALAVLEEVLGAWRHGGREGGWRLAIAPASRDAALRTDVGILCRVLGNMVKNAVEAAGDGGVVTVGCAPVGGGVKFWVHNPGAMPRDVQLQLFQRSFSTKGPGRGLGTYSMKLLTERYLKGRIAFASSPQEGTTFTAWCPLAVDGEPPPTAS